MPRKPPSEQAKIYAAKGALPYIHRHMVVGLGTGSTAAHFIKFLGQLNKVHKLKLRCIATSKDTEKKARAAGLKVVGLDAVDRIDLAVDGADAATPSFTLLKGLGGALTREKIIAYRAKKFVVMVDEGKVRDELEGTVAIEVLPFALPIVFREMKKFSHKTAIRKKNGRPYVTDNGNNIIDLPLRIVNPGGMELALNSIPGVVENGIFTKADILVIGNPNGYRRLKKGHPPREATALKFIS